MNTIDIIREEFALERHQSLEQCMDPDELNVVLLGMDQKGHAFEELENSMSCYAELEIDIYFV